MTDELQRQSHSDQLVALETRIAYQERTIDELNGVLIALRKEMDDLVSKMVSVQGVSRTIEHQG